MRIAILSLLIFLIPSSHCFSQLKVSEIQGNEAISPYLDQFIQLDTVIVTATGQGFLFVESPDVELDTHNISSHGLWILYSGPKDYKVNDLIIAEGVVNEDGNRNTVLVASGVQLVGSIEEHTPWNIDNLRSLSTRDKVTYESLEGRIVHITNAYLVAPLDIGQQAAINPLGTRCFREPGISYPDIRQGIPQFDGNPEILKVEFNRFMADPMYALPAGSIFMTTGIIVQRRDYYALWPINFQVIFTPQFNTVDIDSPESLTIASANLLLFDHLRSDFKLRNKKAAAYVKNVMGYPDVIALQEISSARALEELVEEIGLTPEGFDYQYYFQPGNLYSSLHLAYLYKPCLDSVSFKRLGTFEKMSTGETLHDRPPLLMEIYFNNPALPKIQVLNLHLRSLNGIEGPNQRFVRDKRHEQAISVHRMIESLKSESPFIVTGDFNTLPFSDGYVDVFSQIAGTVSLGSEYPVNYKGATPLKTPLLQLDSAEQYSYIYQNNSQLLDHILTSNTELFESESYHILRGNSDSPENWRNSDQVSWGFSDHDVILARYKLGFTQQCTPPIEAIDEFELQFPNPASQGPQEMIGKHPVDGEYHFSLYTISGQVLFEKNFQASAGSMTINVPIDLKPGIYLVQYTFNGMTKTYKWIIS